MPGLRAKRQIKSGLEFDEPITIPAGDKSINESSQTLLRAFTCKPALVAEHRNSDSILFDPDYLVAQIAVVIGNERLPAQQGLPVAFIVPIWSGAKTWTDVETQ